MKSRERRQRGIEYLSLGVLALGILSACATGGKSAPAVGQIPEVVIANNGDELVVPAVVPAGPVAFVTDVEAWVAPNRLNEGVTREQIEQHVAQNNDPVFSLPLMTMLGGPMVPGGRTVYNLQPGTYAVTKAGDAGKAAGLDFFETGETSGATAPMADVTVDMVDFDFVMPAEIKSGVQTWQISNKGTQWHEMVIVQMAEGKTTDDVLAMLMSDEVPAEPLPFEVVAGWTAMSPGETAWTTIDLPPGDYSVLCFLPDLNGDFAPHLAHGMAAQVAVTP